MTGRVCIASTGLGHVARGIEAWAADLGRALAERGHDLILCKGGGTVEAEYERVIPCWTRESAGAQRLVRCLPRSLGWRLGLGSGYAVEQTTFARQLLKTLRNERIDILHVQDPLLARYVERAHAHGLVETRTILAHGTEEPPEFLQQIRFLQHLAPHHLEEMRALGAWRAEWSAIPNFVDMQKFCPDGSDLRAELGIPQQAQVVLAAAAIKRVHKRIDYLIDEFASLLEQGSDRPAYLVVAGGWEADTDQLIAEGQRRLGERVRFLVRFPRARMPSLYRTANVLVMCSLKEMMPIALLEATASGLPCLVHQHPVVSWMVGPGGAAIDMRQAGCLSGALQQLLNSPRQLQQLGVEARRHCQQHFSCDAIVGQILDYYQAVRQAGPAPSAFRDVAVHARKVSA